MDHDGSSLVASPDAPTRKPPKQEQELTLEVEIGKSRFHANGDGALVLEAFAHFREFYSEKAGVAGLQDAGEVSHAATGGSGAGTAPKPDPKTLHAESSMPLSVFLDAKKLPRGNAAIALGIVVWAKRYKNEESVDADTVKAHWRISKRKVPANIGRDLGTAASEGWLERLASASGKYAVTGYGEKAFDEFPAPEA